MTVTKNRASGVLMPIFSLHGDYSCGSFGREAFAFVDFLAESGFTYWQVLPFCMPDEYGSPYKSYSAFLGDPRFVDLETLCAQGLINAEELAQAKQSIAYATEGERLSSEREALLRRAASRAENREEILCEIEKNEHIKNACRFLALKHQNGGKPWQEWENHLVCEDEYFYFAFVQYHFFLQWARLKRYANEKGIFIIGDLPIYVAEDSADVWESPTQFLLDEQGYPTDVAGVPPDYFAPEGQLWGNPLYRWSEMKKDGFLWWRERLSHTLSLFDGVRFDHFRGFESFWSVPSSAKTAKEGSWKKGPGYPFFKAMREVAGDRLLIAEDLGDITPAVNSLRDRCSLPGMRVLQFAFLGDNASVHLPHNYPQNCVAYTGTHDNNTLLGYVWELSEDDRAHLLDYCNYTDANWDKCYDAVLRTMLQSHAGVVVFPIQDLLGFGSDTRFNTPGKTRNNWCFRITKEQFAAIDRARFRHLNHLYGRI